MTPKMQEVLYQLSLCCDPDPGVVFHRIVEAVSDYYGGTMAMINLTEGNCIAARALVNPHRVLRRVTSLELQNTFCQFALRSARPLLIQNAAADPAYCNHPAIRVGLTRYLGVPIRDPGGQPIGTLCFLDSKSDETLCDEDARFLSVLAARVNAEVERERIVQARVEEHQAAARRLEELNARLEATAEEKRRFVRMVIHDLRHPLTAIRTVLYLLGIEEDPTERALLVTALENRLEALNRLLEGLTHYNEVEAGRALLHIERVDLATVVRACLENFAPAFSSESVQLACEIAPHLGEGETDCDKLTHILLNLLSNALKFTPQGCVWVRAHPQGQTEWVLEVEDTGIGIRSEEQERIFEEFYQAGGTSAGGQQGSGLGLAIVRRLCQAMDASVTVRSVPGAGTCFQIAFPRYSGQE